MLFKLFLLFTIIPVIELWLLIEVGTIFGSLHTIGMIFLTGFVGAFIARYQGLTVLQRLTVELNEGRFPAEEMLDGLFVLIGGVMLLTPGFITDTIGFSFLFPLTRTFYKKILSHYIKDKFRDDGHFDIKYVGRSF